tara:strand:+ start:152 stop:1033 length:882 start_codon:yes stop_codon:yes gene_type:complete
MPYTPVTPEPITPTNPSSGRQGFSTSAAFTTSGVGEGALEGPWSIEEQTLYINYFRVPNAYMTQASATLTSLTTTNVIGRTRLAYSVEASYKKYQDDGRYATSSWEQSQVLEVLAVSSDANGVSYGDLHSSAMGPQGTVVTTRKWLRRRAWDSDIDEETNQTANAWNFAYIGSGCGNMWGGDQGQVAGNQIKFSIMPGHQGSPMYLQEKAARFVTQPTYSINGEYATNTETLFEMISFIDGVGDQLANPSIYSGGYYSEPATIEDPEGSQPEGPVRDQRVLGYRSHRHDWSGD